MLLRLLVVVGVLHTAHGFFFDIPELRDTVINCTNACYPVSGESFYVTCTVNNENLGNSSDLAFTLEFLDGRRENLNSSIVDDRIIRTELYREVNQTTKAFLSCSVNNVQRSNVEVYFGLPPPQLTADSVTFRLDIVSMVLHVEWCHLVDVEWVNSEVLYRADPQNGYENCNVTPVECRCVIRNPLLTSYQFKLNLSSMFWIVTNTFRVNLNHKIKSGPAPLFLAERKNSTSVLLRWGTPAYLKAEQNLALMLYEVTVLAMDGSKREDLTTRHQNISLYSLEVYKEYKIKLQINVNSSPHWSDVQEIRVRTNASAPCRGPDVMYRFDTCPSDSDDCYSLTLFIEPLEPSCWHGAPGQFQIELLNQSSHSQLVSMIPALQHHAQIKSLSKQGKRGEELLQLMAVSYDEVDNSQYYSPAVARRLPHPDTALPGLELAYVETTDDVGTYTLHFKYDQPIKSFKVLTATRDRVNPLLIQSAPQTILVAGDNRNVTFNVSNGDVNDTLVFSVAVVDAEGRTSSLTSSWLYACRHDSRPGAVDSSIFADREDVKVAWSTPVCDGKLQLAHARRYELELYNTKGILVQQHVEDEWGTSHEFSGLQPDSHYELRLQAVSAAGAGPPSVQPLKTLAPPGVEYAVIIPIAVAIPVCVFIIVIFCVVRKCCAKASKELPITAPVRLKTKFAASCEEQRIKPLEASPVTTPVSDASSLLGSGSPTSQTLFFPLRSSGTSDLARRRAGNGDSNGGSENMELDTISTGLTYDSRVTGQGDGSDTVYGSSGGSMNETQLYDSSSGGCAIQQYMHGHTNYIPKDFTSVPSSSIPSEMTDYPEVKVLSERSDQGPQSSGKIENSNESSTASRMLSESSEEGSTSTTETSADQSQQIDTHVTAHVISEQTEVAPNRENVREKGDMNCITILESNEDDTIDLSPGEFNDVQDTSVGNRDGYFKMIPVL